MTSQNLGYWLITKQNENFRGKKKEEERKNFHKEKKGKSIKYRPLFFSYITMSD